MLRSGQKRVGVTLVVGAWLGAVGGVAWNADGAEAPVEDRLPDLIQEPPRELSVRRVDGRDLLGFRSAVQNVGVGPLTITGRRASVAVSDMTARQIIERTDGSTRHRTGAGFVRYVRSSDHDHWHFFPFERYELRRPGASGVIVRDNKTGFCLGDRYRVEPRPANAAVAPAFTTNCGLRSPRRLTIREGISVGWADDYAAYLDGQHIDVTGLRSGVYVLVHRVNPARRLEETNYANNAASVRIELTRGTTGRMRVRVLPAA